MAYTRVSTVDSECTSLGYTLCSTISTVPTVMDTSNKWSSLFFYGAHFSFTTIAYHILVCINTQADAFSCNKLNLFRSLIYRSTPLLVPNPHQILQLTLANSLDWTVVHMRQMFTTSLTAAYLPQPGGDTTPSNNAYFDFCQHANIVNTLCTYVTVNTSNINPLSVICLQPDMHRLQDSQIPFIAQACQG